MLRIGGAVQWIGFGAQVTLVLLQLLWWPPLSYQRSRLTIHPTPRSVLSGVSFKTFSLNALLCFSTSDDHAKRWTRWRWPLHGRVQKARSPHLKPVERVGAQTAQSLVPNFCWQCSMKRLKTIRTSWDVGLVPIEDKPIQFGCEILDKQIRRTTDGG